MTDETSAPKAKKPMESITLRLERDVVESLNALAEKSGKSLNGILRPMIKRGLKVAEKKGKFAEE